MIEIGGTLNIYREKWATNYLPGNLGHTKTSSIEFGKDEILIHVEIFIGEFTLRFPQNGQKNQVGPPKMHQNDYLGAYQHHPFLDINQMTPPNILFFTSNIS